MALQLTNNITKAIGRSCKNNQGGVSKLYLFPYVKYSKSQNLTDDQEVTTFPATVAYLYEAENVSFTESTSVKNGGVEWTQKLSFTITKSDSSSEIYRLVKKDYSAVILDRNGNYRFIGMRNGSEVTINSVSGTGIGDLNGYNVSLTAREDNQAYYVPTFESLFTIVNPAVFQLPTSPSNLVYRYYTGGSSISLDWDASAAGTEALAGYYVYVNGSLHQTINFGTNVTIGYLQPSTSYSFYVKAYDIEGNTSGSSNTINVTSVSGGAYELRVANDFGYTESLECINI